MQIIFNSPPFSTLDTEHGSPIDVASDFHSGGSHSIVGRGPALVIKVSCCFSWSFRQMAEVYSYFEATTANSQIRVLQIHSSQPFNATQRCKSPYRHKMKTTQVKLTSQLILRRTKINNKYMINGIEIKLKSLCLMSLS
jgi:hypothetical protein